MDEIKILKKIISLMLVSILLNLVIIPVLDAKSHKINSNFESLNTLTEEITLNNQSTYEINYNVSNYQELVEYMNILKEDLSKDISEYKIIGDGCSIYLFVSALFGTIAMIIVGVGFYIKSESILFLALVFAGLSYMFDIKFHECRPYY